ncbi:MAG: hypothetical protein OXH65_11950 [Paracoccaceae bacterium]|nr:hypothetical protein [Paracoccaceae bacterium]MDE2675808.1 hypothetical protein [Paracoccaceae bacterium]MDE2737900.1 hypothetical protein [Paracoccaceae bacterium]
MADLFFQWRTLPTIDKTLHQIVLKGNGLPSRCPDTSEKGKIKGINLTS